MNTNVLIGIKCPNCHSLGPFRVAVVVRGDALVSDDGIEELDRTESEFLDGHDWHCVECGHDFLPEEDA